MSYSEWYFAVGAALGVIGANIVIARSRKPNEDTYMGAVAILMMVTVIWPLLILGLPGRLIAKRAHQNELRARERQRVLSTDVEHLAP